MNSGIGTIRLEVWVFGSNAINVVLELELFVFNLSIVRLILMQWFSKSTSHHFKPATSPKRKPPYNDKIITSV